MAIDERHDWDKVDGCAGSAAFLAELSGTYQPVVRRVRDLVCVKVVFFGANGSGCWRVARRTGGWSVMLRVVCGWKRSPGTVGVVENGSLVVTSLDGVGVKRKSVKENSAFCHLLVGSENRGDGGDGKEHNGVVPNVQLKNENVETGP